MSENNFQEWGVLRPAAILTNAYVVADALTQINNVQNVNQLVIYADFTIGSLTTGNIQVEASVDGSDWYITSFTTVSGGVSTLSIGQFDMGATGKYKLTCPIADKYIRISAKGTGTLTGSSLKLTAQTSLT